MREHATVPTVIDGDGNCHIYVDRAADLDIAVAIVVNAKTSRPGVCNAAESLLVHGDVAREFLPRLATAMPDVELVGDDRTRRDRHARASPTKSDYETEFLSLEDVRCGGRRHTTARSTTSACTGRDIPKRSSRAT